jgi:hypothetical protein
MLTTLQSTGLSQALSDYSRGIHTHRDMVMLVNESAGSYCFTDSWSDAFSVAGMVPHIGRFAGIAMNELGFFGSN